MDTAIFTKITSTLYQYVGISFCILGNLGNFFCLLIFCQRSWKKKVCVFYFLICLLLDSIYINISTLGATVVLGFNILFTASNVALCKMFNYITLLFPTLSPTILICASIDRLLISSRNVETRLYSSRRLAYLLISTSLMCWSIYFIHILIKFDIQRLSPLVSICLFNTAEFYGTFLSYSTFTINIVSFVVMIIFSALSYKNVRRIRLIPRQQRQVGRTMHKKDFQLLRCLFAKDIIYIVCNTFLCIFFVYKFIPRSQAETVQEQRIATFYFHVSSLIRNVPSCASFYTYIVISKAFRQDFQRLIWKMIGKDITNIREEANEQEVREVANEMVVVSTIVT